MYIGATLLFSEQSPDSLEGWLNSYIFEAENSEELSQKTNQKAQQVIQAAESGNIIAYFGIEDVFKISGPFKNHAVLGRESIWDINLKYAKDLILPPDKWTFNSRTEDLLPEEWCIAKSIYFIQEPKECYVVIYNIACCAKEIGKKLDQWATKGSFITEFETPDSMPVKPQFLGYEDIINVIEDPKDGGAFLMSYLPLESADEISDMAPDNEKIEGFWRTYSD